MAAVVRIHRPVLIPEERERKMEEIQKSTMDFHKNVTREKK